MQRSSGCGCNRQHGHPHGSEMMEKHNVHGVSLSDKSELVRLSHGYPPPAVVQCGIDPLNRPERN